MYILIQSNLFLVQMYNGVYIDIDIYEEWIDVPKKKQQKKQSLGKTTCIVDLQAEEWTMKFQNLN